MIEPAMLTSGRGSWLALAGWALLAVWAVMVARLAIARLDRDADEPDHPERDGRSKP